MDDKEKEITIIAEAEFKEFGKDYFNQDLAKLSEDGKEIMHLNQNLDNGSYVFTYQGKNYQLNLIALANSFVKEMRKRDPKN